MCIYIFPQPRANAINIKSTQESVKKKKKKDQQLNRNMGKGHKQAVHRKINKASIETY